MEESQGGGLKVVAWVVLVVLVAWGIFALVKSEPKETGPINIGVMLPLTGDAATYGEPAGNILKMAVEEINTAGGVDGRLLNLIMEDSKCNGKDGVNAVQKLINVDKVQIIIGGFCSSESLAAAPIAEAAGVALFSPGSSNPGLTNISPFFFRNYPSDASQGQVLARVAFNDKGWKNVAFIQEQTDYAEGVYKAFSEEFTKLGGVVTNESFPTATTDFRSIVSKVKDLKPDAVFLSTQTPAVAERVIQQAGQLKYKPALLVSDAISGDVAMVAKNAVFLEGTLAAEFGTDPQNPKFQKLLADYKVKYGTEAPFQSYAQTEYDAVYMLRDALLAVGNNGKKISDWSRTVKNWEGASGKVTILPSGDRDGGHVPKVVVGGKVLLYTK